MLTLGKQFDEFNRLCFEGRLPKYRVILSNLSNMPPSAHGQCDGDSQTILLSKGLSETELKVTLLHEMCHIGCVGHGKRFLNKLTRLALSNDEWVRNWAIAEGKLYSKDNVIPWNVLVSDVRDQLWQLAYRNPSYSFRKIVANVANLVGLVPKDVERKLPWLRNAWKNCVNEAKQVEQLKRKRKLSAQD